MQQWVQEVNQTGLKVQKLILEIGQAEDQRNHALAQLAELVKKYSENIGAWIFWNLQEAESGLQELKQLLQNAEDAVQKSKDLLLETAQVLMPFGSPTILEKQQVS